MTVQYIYNACDECLYEKQCNGKKRVDYPRCLCKPEWYKDKKDEKDEK